MHSLKHFIRWLPYLAVYKLLAVCRTAVNKIISAYYQQIGSCCAGISLLASGVYGLGNHYALDAFFYVFNRAVALTSVGAAAL